MSITTDKLIKAILVFVIIALVVWGLIFIWTSYLKPYFEGIPEFDDATGAVLETIQQVENEITPSDIAGTGDCSGPLVAVPAGLASSQCGEGCKVRESLISRLQEAKKIAESKGLRLYVNSAYRSEAVQRSLRQRKGNLACGPDKSGSYSHCPHVLGCAVDVSLSKRNNGLMEDIMYQAGFIRYCKESWHFEYGTRSWSRVAGTGSKTYGDCK